MQTLVFPKSILPTTTRLPVMFVITSMPVGGAETLLVNLIRRMDRSRFAPELCCLKSLGPLGEVMAREIPTFNNLLSNKWDIGVLGRLTRLLKERRTAAVITVGAGDKMFWGRLAARRAGVPVVISAIHSTGWPDAIGRLNRMLTPWTDAFIGVAAPHGRYLIDEEGFPAHKVRVIPNGVDVDKFNPSVDGSHVRTELGLSATTPVAGIVAALRPEKDHATLLRAMAIVHRSVPDAHLLIVGDGPERPVLEVLSRDLSLDRAVHFLGTRSDIPQLLAAMDVFVLTSRMEASPVSILEAMAIGKPVIAPRVGSIPDSVAHGQTGFLTDPGNVEEVASRLVELFLHPDGAAAMGKAGRALVERRWSLDCMVDGYQRLIEEIYARKRGGGMSERVSE
jgi:glycosyltransferase involved in cell wall biosynthesis